MKNRETSVTGYSYPLRRLPLTVHFFHRPNEVLRVLEADETVPLALARPLVPDHFGTLEGGILVERARQQLIVDVVAEIAAKDAEVVLRPVRQ